MKPFDLEKAKAGKKVVDEQGREVTILDFNFKDSGGRSILGKYKNSEGFDVPRLFKPRRLFMAPVKKKGFIAICQNSDLFFKKRIAETSGVFTTKEDLKDYAKWATDENIIPIEWEE